MSRTLRAGNPSGPAGAASDAAKSNPPRGISPWGASMAAMSPVVVRTAADTLSAFQRFLEEGEQAFPMPLRASLCKESNAEASGYAGAFCGYICYSGRSAIPPTYACGQEGRRATELSRKFGLEHAGGPNSPRASQSVSQWRWVLTPPALYEGSEMTSFHITLIS